MAQKHIKQIGPQVWWAYVTKPRKDGGTDIEGDMWESSNAEALARAWFDARPEAPPPNSPARTHERGSR